LFFISLTSTSNECAPRTEAQTSPCSRIYFRRQVLLSQDNTCLC
jgi:hypothetical protein